MQSKDDKEKKSPQKGRSPRATGHSDAEDPKDASLATAPAAEKKEEHKTPPRPPRPSARPKAKSPDVASHSAAAIGSPVCLACKHREEITRAGEFIESAVEFPIERAMSFEELTESFRLEEAAGISEEESSSQEQVRVPQEPPRTSPRSYMTKSASPSGGSVLVLSRMSITGGGQATSKSEDSAAKSPVKPEKQETSLSSPQSTSPRMLYPSRTADEERDALFKSLRLEISCPFSSLQSIQDLVETILEKGYNLDTISSSSITPLVVAVMVNRPDVARLLLDYGANPNNRIYFLSQYTALHIACMHGGPCDSLPMVTLLVQRGASLSALTNMGQTPLEIARLYRNRAAVSYFQSLTRERAEIKETAV